MRERPFHLAFSYNMIGSAMSADRESAEHLPDGTRQ